MSAWAKPFSVIRRHPFRSAVAAFAMVLVLLAAGVLALLYTEPGRAALAQTIASALSKPGETEVHISDLRGSLPAEIRVDSITVGDADGKWLEVRDFVLDWSPLRLIEGKLQIDSARAGHVAVLRRPAPAGQATTGDSSGAILPPIQIVVDSLAIDNLQLDEPVLGEPARLTVAAGAAALKTRATAHLKIERVDGRHGRVSLALDWDEPSGSLDIDASLSEPADGLVARLMDLPGKPPLEFSITGEGPARDWQGQASLEAGALISAESSLSVSVDRRFGLAMKGSATPGESLGADISTLLGPKSAFDLELHREAGADAWVVAVNKLESAALTASGQATFDTAASRVAGNLTVATADVARLARFTAPATFEAAEAKIDAEGPLMQPVIRLSGSTRNLAFEGFSAAAAVLHAELRPDRSLASPDASIAVQGDLSLSGLAMPSKELGGVLGDKLSLAVTDSRLDGYTQLQLGKVRATAGSVEASLTGEMALDRGALNGSGEIGVGNLTPFSDVAGRPISGRVQTEFQIARSTGGTVDLVLEGALRDATFGQPEIERLLGPEALFSGKAKRRPDGALAISDLRLSGKGAEATAKASLPPDARTLEAEYDLTVNDLAAINIADPGDAGGSLGVSGKVSGPIASPTIEGRMRLNGAAAGGLRLKRIEGTFTAADIAGTPNGAVSLQGETDRIPDFTGKTRFRLAEKRLALSELALSARKTSVKGGLAIPLDGGAVRGDLAVSSDDLGAWSEIAGQTLAGDIDGNIRLSGEGKRQDVSVDAKATGLAFAGQISSRRSTLNLTAADVTGAPRLKGSLVGNGIQGGGVGLDEISLNAEGPLSDLQYRLKAAGAVRDRGLSLNSDGRLRRTDERTTLAIAGLSGEVAGIPVRLRKPAQIQIAPAIDSGQIDVALGDGGVQLRYAQGRDDVSLRADVVSVPLASVWPSAPSALEQTVVEATISLDGPAARPEGRLEVSAFGLAAGETDQNEAGLALHLNADLKDGKLDASGRIDGLAGVNSRLQMTVPASLSLSPAKFSLDQRGPVTGSVTYVGPVGPAWSLAGLDRHRLSGKGDVDLNFSGTLDAPRVSGHFELSDGRYENLDTGTILSDMQIVARPSNSSLTIERATAKDGGKGEISLTGGIEFGAGQLASLNLETHFKRANLVRRDDLNATMSGDIALRGNAFRRKVAGTVVVDEAEIRLSGGMPSGIVEIPVEETGTPPPGATRPPAPARSSRTELDLRIKIANRVFVRGRGLDSEWAGDLRVTGTVANPQLQGELRPLKGRYDFAGKIFVLEEGKITFTGGNEINPTLDLAAKRETSDLRAIIRVTGTAKKPKVTLESIPSYPEDEILSRILFDKSTGRLTTLEAVRLAEAVAALTGESEGGGIMDFARNMLNLDVLNIEGGGTEGEGSAEAGKYINDQIYLGVQGTSTGGTGVTVEVEITPHLKLEGDVGSKEKSELGLKWKKDY